MSNTYCTDSNAIKSRVRNAERTGYEIVFSAWIKCLIKRDNEAADLLKAHLGYLKGKTMNNENNDSFFDVPSVETDETRRCPNEWCSNELMPDDDENESCQECAAAYAIEAAAYLRDYKASKGRLSKDEVLDAYSDPTESAKRARMERDY